MKRIPFDTRVQTALQGIWAAVPVPKSQDPIDEILHGVGVADRGRKFFDRVHKKRLEGMIENLDSRAAKRIEELILATKENDAGGSALVLAGQHFQLQLATKRGQERTNIQAFVNELRKRGVKQETIDAALVAATDRNSPVKTFSVLEQE